MSKYNGWKNYQTWLCGLWYNDTLSEHYLELFREGELLEPVTGEMVKDFVESLMEECDQLPESGFTADLVNAALREVDWQELADHVEDVLKYEMEAA